MNDFYTACDPDFTLKYLINYLHANKFNDINIHDQKYKVYNFKYIIKYLYGKNSSNFH
jgi:hypothetical protein